MAWWVQLLVGTVFTGNLAFWGWLACKVIDQGRKLVELESRIDSRDMDCHARMEWMRAIDGKVNEIAAGVSFIRGKMEH